MALRKRAQEEGKRAHIYFPGDLLEYVDKKAEELGYGASRSSVLREMILRDKRETEGYEKNRNR